MAVASAPPTSTRSSRTPSAVPYLITTGVGHRVPSSATAASAKKRCWRMRSGGADPGEGEQRMARLLDPGVGDGRDVAARRGAELAPEIVGGGVAFAVALEVGAHAAAERLGAEEALDHAHDPGALPVRDDVEALGGLFGVHHLERDRMGRFQRVEVERPRQGGDEVAPHPPLGHQIRRRSCSR